MTPTTDTQKVWTTFLMEAELAKNHKMANVMSGGLGGLPAPNPILDMLLPSLLYVRLGSLIDEALAEYIDLHGLVIAKPYKEDFNGRTCFLADQGRLNDAAKIHAIRKQRNLLAHEANQSCTWEVVAAAITEGHAELQHLGIVGVRPVYEFFGERSAMKAGNPGYAFSQDYCYGLKENGQRVIGISWTVNYGGAGDGEAPTGG